MNGFRDDALRNFHDREYREAFVEEFLNSWIATQIKALREQRQWTQEKLAEEAGMRQPRISALENIDYSSWSVSTLRRLAKAFDVDLAVEFRSYGKRLLDFARFERGDLEEAPFPMDSLFQRAMMVASLDSQLADLIRPSTQTNEGAALESVLNIAAPKPFRLPPKQSDLATILGKAA